MKTFLGVSLTLFLVLASVSLNAQAVEYSHEYAVVGKQPAAIFINQYNLPEYNIICRGFDANNNGILDDGDEAPSWWKAYFAYICAYDYPGRDLGGMYEKLKDFDFGDIGFPFRGYFYDKALYLPQNGKIIKFDASNGEVLDSCVLAVNASAVSVIDKYLIVSVRNDIAASPLESDKVLIYDMTAKEIIKTFNMDMNVQQTLPFEYQGGIFLAAVLCEGTDSLLGTASIIGINTDIMMPLKFQVGKHPNHISISNDKQRIAVVISGENKVRIYPVQANGAQYDEILLPDEPNVMPRESAFGKENNLYVSSRDGYVYSYNLDNLTLLEKFQINGAGEGLLASDISSDELYNDLFFASANTLTYPDYAPNDTVTFMRQYQTSVRDTKMMETMVYPNPASISSGERVIIDLSKIDFQESNLRIIDVFGKEIASIQLENTEKFALDLSKYNLSSGVYNIEISNNKKIYSTRLVLVK